MQPSEAPPPSIPLRSPGLIRSNHITHADFFSPHGFLNKGPQAPVYDVILPKKSFAAVVVVNSSEFITILSLPKQGVYQAIKIN